ncbi:MAG: Flp family type IVb pilin [Nitrospirota bacterium]|nr:Flp family type IVb pilin [Nitrospirota bacterium]MDH5585106.1 Flp family type IVb pilin [Nitrospirota bacterium]MDH5773934.1 Flp family type IVb pilin [Nitrospirota bacterium]
MFNFFHDEQGTAAVEYSLLMSLIGLFAAAALHALGGDLLNAFSSVSAGLNPIQLIEDSRQSGLIEKF